MIQKVNDKIKLQAYIKISNVFNVEDLTQRKGDAHLWLFLRKKTTQT